MRVSAIILLPVLVFAAPGAELESRVLTHYVPQDLLDTAVRTEGWTEIQLNLKGGIRKGDLIRIWAGGSIDRGNADQPGQNVAGPAGVEPGKKPAEGTKWGLSQEPGHAFAILFKTEEPGIKKCPPPGKPLEITLTKDKDRLWAGFNDQRGRYHDNHLGKGSRHEFDPLWIRIEVVRTIVD